MKLFISLFQFINAQENLVCVELRIESNDVCQSVGREVNTKFPLQASAIRHLNLTLLDPCCLHLLHVNTPEQHLG